MAAEELDVTVKRILGAALTLVMLLSACGSAGEKDGGRKTKTRVVTAFYPLEFVTGAVAGNKADVSNLTPAGVEPHNLELTSGQVRQVLGADLLVFLGEGFQPALEEVAKDAEGRVLNLASVAQPPILNDPHVWLDPVFMVGMTTAVAQALGEVDERNAASYQRNAKALVEELKMLDNSFQAGLTRCVRREFVTSHSAFGYMAQRFNLEQVGISGIDPEQEPSAKRLAEVSALVKKRGVTTIFFERLLPPDLAETVAKETGARTATLDPIESPPASGDYLRAMRTNLEALRAALSCK